MLLPRTKQPIALGPQDVLRYTGAVNFPSVFCPPRPGVVVGFRFLGKRKILAKHRTKRPPPLFHILKLQGFELLGSQLGSFWRQPRRFFGQRLHILRPAQQTVGCWH